MYICTALKQSTINWHRLQGSDGPKPLYSIFCLTTSYAAYTVVLSPFVPPTPPARGVQVGWMVPPLRPPPPSALHPPRFAPHYSLQGFSLTGQQLALPPRYRAVLSPASAFTPVPFSVPTPAHLHAAASSMVSPAMWSALPIARKLFQRLAASTPGACWPCPLPGRTITNDENLSLIHI